MLLNGVQAVVTGVDEKLAVVLDCICTSFTVLIWTQPDAQCDAKTWLDDGRVSLR